MEEVTKIKTRMIHIRLPEDLHKRVRIRAAEADETIQDWVVGSIEGRLQQEMKQGVKKSTPTNKLN